MYILLKPLMEELLACLLVTFGRAKQERGDVILDRSHLARCASLLFWSRSD